MQATLPLKRSTILSHEATVTTSALPEPSCAIDEINSYLGVRDLLLRQAEELTTETNLRRARMANEFTEKCLRPARSPYQAQCLPEEDAALERQRCKSVKVRIAELRAQLGAHHFVRHCEAA